MKAVRESLYFFGRFLKQPKRVASVLPSSKFLAAKMFEGIQLNHGDSIVEFGPGTGALTLEVAKLQENGLRIRYLGIERDPGMHRHLCQRFPHLDFILGDVRNVADYVEQRQLKPVKVVISGIPLVWLPKSTLDAIFVGMQTFMAEDGEFRAFSYVHAYGTNGATLVRQRMQNAFNDYRISRPVLRNLPPALVIRGTGLRHALA